MAKTCVSCGKVIPKERIKVFPDTEYCVKCSPVKKYTESDIRTPWGRIADSEAEAAHLNKDQAGVSQPDPTVRGKSNRLD